jgi:sulfonate transport system ATP-binding protein
VPANKRLPDAEPVVRLRGLTRAFGHDVVLDSLNLDLASGSFTALLGHSGSGKSTLLRTLAGLDVASHGTVSVPAKRAVVFQEPRLVLWKRLINNITLGLRASNAREKALAALGDVGLSHRLNAWPLTLSGGEAQRAALARALVQDPQLLLLDEPFAALDALTRLKMQQLVLDLWQRRRPAVLLVTHDVDEALLLADRVLVLKKGRISLDIPLTPDHPREPGHPALNELRRRLLSELGVPVAAHGHGLATREPDAITHV